MAKTNGWTTIRQVSVQHGTSMTMSVMTQNWGRDVVGPPSRRSDRPFLFPWGL